MILSEQNGTFYETVKIEKGINSLTPIVVEKI